MNKLRTFAILVAAGAAFMVLAGTGSASADVICSTNTNPCTGTMYPAHTAVSASLKAGTEAVLTSSAGEVKCKKSATTGETTTTGSATENLLGKISTLTFEECKLGTTNCTVASVHKPYAAEIVATSAGNGTLRVGNGGTGNPGATVVCGVLVNCEFTTALAELAVDGGSPALATANGIALSRSGGICPTTSEWDAIYSITAPNPLFPEAS